jgi:predicted AlkP superfamily phosphohydrolase/phosphomutase
MNRSKVLVIGLDGGTFTVLEPFAREGLIPNLARLMETGARGVLRSTVPPISAPAWATFQTGKNPGKHGLFNFFDLSETGFRQSHDFRQSRVVNHANIGSATIYDYLREGGRRVISVNVPLTYPTPEVEGNVVSCWLTPPGARDFTWPRSLVDELPEYRIDQDFGEGMYAVTPRGRELDSDYLFDDLTDILQKRADAAVRLIREKPWDVAIVCFTETDRIHHYFWRAIDPAYPDRDAPHVVHERERFRAFYAALDRRIGDLIEAAGPDVDVLVVSDHGFDGPPRRRYHVSHWMAERGWLVAKDGAGRGRAGGSRDDGGPDAAQGVPAAGSANPFFQVARGAWQRLVPRRVRDRVYARVGYSPRPREVDWARTRAWSFGVNNNLGAICINVRDGGEGCVAPGDEVAKLTDEIVAGLKALRDPESGRPVVREVMRREEVYRGPYTERFPHILFTLDPDFEANLESGYTLPAERIEAGPIYPTGRGNHRPEGICIAAGPDIAPGAKPDADLASIMPTVLHLCGVTPPDDLDGRVLTEYLSQAARERQGSGTGQPAQHRFAEATEEDVEALQDKLRKLGYM